MRSAETLWRPLCGRRTGRGPRTLLTDLVFAQLKVVDVGGLVQFTYDPQTDKKQIAALAPLLPGV